MGGKQVRSFSIPESLDEVIREQQDVNWSAAVTQFLQEYAASGQSTEAALAVRKEQLQDELAEAKKVVDQKERELERVEAALQEKRENRRDVFESFHTLNLPEDRLTSSNDAVQRHAERVGMNPETFLSNYREWK